VVLQKGGNTQEARSCFERAWSVFQTVLGDGHPKTAMARGHLMALHTLRN